MGQSIIQVDAFTDQPFRGNPAAVCLLAEAREEQWMQDVAREMNLAETAFLYPEADGFRLRWFTPTVEVDLCGHATLAGAHALWEEGVLPSDVPARFHTKSGVLTATRRPDGWIELDFPATPPRSVVHPPDLLAGLGVRPLYVGKSRFDYLVEVADPEVVHRLGPDLTILKNLPVRGVIVTAASSDPYDFVSRYFAPQSGVDEDPVTGSAHCCLGPYWQGRLDRDTFLAYQASARGGVVRVRVQGDRVLLGGQAITVLRGELVT